MIYICEARATSDPVATATAGTGAKGATSTVHGPVSTARRATSRARTSKPTKEGGGCITEIATPYRADDHE